MTLYITKCNCQLFREELKVLKKDGANPRLRCKKHLGYITGRITQCVDCGIDIIYKPKGPTPERCKKHVIAFNKARPRKKYKQKPKKKKKKVIVKPKKKIVIKVKPPIKVFSVKQARRMGINCIPLNFLFELRESLGKNNSF